MNRDRAQPLIMKLFSGFNKHDPDPRQVGVYLDWAVKYPEETVKKTVKDMIEMEDRFPTIAKLHRTARKTRSREYVEKEDCYYCSGTGFVPALFKGTMLSGGIPYVRNMACKCSSGMRHRSIPPEYEGGPRKPMDQYFDRFERPQFEEEIKEHSDKTYTQIVYWMQANSEVVKV